MGLVWRDIEELIRELKRHHDDLIRELQRIREEVAQLRRERAEENARASGGEQVVDAQDTPSTRVHPDSNESPAFVPWSRRLPLGAIVEAIGDRVAVRDYARHGEIECLVDTWEEAFAWLREGGAEPAKATGHCGACGRPKWANMMGVFASILPDPDGPLCGAEALDGHRRWADPCERLAQERRATNDDA